MQIVKDKVVTINYTLKGNDGQVIDEQKDGEFVYLHGASNIIPGLEDSLKGKKAGESLSVSIPPENAYGMRDDARKQTVAKTMFPEGTEIAVGMEFHAEGPGGEMVLVTISEIQDDMVTVDGNHPLAGIDLNFDVEILEVRDASEEELTHGHVHGAGGCDH